MYSSVRRGPTMLKGCVCVERGDVRITVAQARQPGGSRREIDVVAIIEQCVYNRKRKYTVDLSDNVRRGCSTDCFVERYKRNVLGVLENYRPYYTLPHLAPASILLSHYSTGVRVKAKSRKNER